MGGLGLKCSKDMNLALLAKQGWRLYTQPDAFWTKVLYEKHSHNFEEGLVLNIHQRNSSTWKGIATAWNAIEKGAVWCPGFGEDVKFWKDRWLLDTPLQELQELHIPADELECSARDYYDGKTGWDWVRLQNLPQHIKDKLNTTMLVNDQSRSKSLVWTRNTSGCFTTKSAYMLLQSWISWNLRVEAGKCQGFDWCTVFGAAILKIWLWRNKFVFEGAVLPLNTKVRIILTEAKAYMGGMSSYSSAQHHIIQIAWPPPEEGWVKQNSDGAQCKHSRAAAAGGVLRNASGHWLGGFNTRLGTCSATESELWGCWKALQVAWNLGYKKVIYETDSLQLEE